MLPRPNVGAFFTLFYITVFIYYRVDKLYIAVILFLFGIDNIEDSFRSRKSRENIVELLGKVCYRLCELLWIQKEWADCADSRIAGNYKKSAENAKDCIINIRKVAHNRHKNTRKRICARSRAAKITVKFVESVNRFALVVKNLYYLLPFNGFFNITVGNA